jgi:hypothetical protein
MAVLWGGRGAGLMQSHKLRLCTWGCMSAIVWCLCAKLRGVMLHKTILVTYHCENSCTLVLLVFCSCQRIVIGMVAWCHSLKSVTNIPSMPLTVSFFFWPCLQNCEKWLLVLSCPFICISIFVEQLCSTWTDFQEICYLRSCLRSVEKMQVWLKSDKNNRYFTWRDLWFMIFH